MVFSRNMNFEKHTIRLCRTIEASYQSNGIKKYAALAPEVRFLVTELHTLVVMPRIPIILEAQPRHIAFFKFSYTQNILHSYEDDAYPQIAP